MYKYNMEECLCNIIFQILFQKLYHEDSLLQAFPELKDCVVCNFSHEITSSHGS